MIYPLRMQREFVDRFVLVASSPEPDLAVAALMIARLEHPRLDASPYLARLDAMGTSVRARLDAALAAFHEQTDHVELPVADQVSIVNRYLFAEEGFAGNREQYEDPRNSCLNDVLDRRTGIPISLAVIYLEVGRRAGVRVEGVNFPGHFLLRARGASPEAYGHRPLIIDAFDRGALLSEGDCRDLLRRQAGEEAPFSTRLLAAA
ncbi:MAG TPA: transglutaminase-like domain-containing protein, partial [Vicinamibacterales bacterium]|nr:transglutaminase-like domain-containing protein [Vicinamibacterales bacterium]